MFSNPLEFRIRIPYPLTIELCTLCSCAGPGLPKASEVLSVNNKLRNAKEGTKGPQAHPYSWPTAGNMNRKSSSNGAVRTANALRTSLHFRDADSMKNKTSQQRDHPIVEEMTEDGHCTFTVCPMPPFAPRHRWLQYTEQAGGLVWELRFGLHSEERRGEERREHIERKS